MTGGALGIGAAVSRRLAEAGAHVTIADMSRAGEATAQGLRSDGLSAAFVVCDITNAAQLDAAVKAARGDGALDILINNAGIYPTTGPIEADA